MRIKVIHNVGDYKEFQSQINDFTDKPNIEVTTVSLSTSVDKDLLYYTALIMYKTKEDNGK